MGIADNTKGKEVIYDKEEAFEMAKEVFSLQNIAVSLSLREALCIANEDIYWRKIKRGELLKKLAFLRNLHNVIDKYEEEIKGGMAASVGKMKFSYHFHKRVLQRYEEEHILKALKGAMKVVRRKIMDSQIKSPALVIRERYYTDDRKEFQFSLSLRGGCNIDFITVMPPPPPPEKKKSKKKGKGLTRAERRALKELKKLKEG